MKTFELRFMTGGSHYNLVIKANDMVSAKCEARSLLTMMSIWDSCEITCWLTGKLETVENANTVV